MKSPRHSLYGFVIIALFLAASAVSGAWTIKRSANPSTQQSQQKGDLNERMVRFCRARLGKKVGTGQCADLTMQALLAIGAKTQFKDCPRDSDYVWGTLIGRLEVKNGKKFVEMSGAGKSAEGHRHTGLKAGDIIQFRDAVFQGRFGRGTYRRMCPHHTAVIEQVSQDGSSCKVLEQNASGKLYVIENDLRLPDLTGGWLRIYRPIAKRAVPNPRPLP